MTDVKIIDFATALESLGNPNDIEWWDLSDEEQERLDYDFFTCNHCHPGPFEMGDVQTVTVVKYERDGGPQSYGDLSVEWKVALKDGRAFEVKAWHDYTGWDCQSGATYAEVGGQE